MMALKGPLEPLARCVRRVHIPIRAFTTSDAQCQEETQQQQQPPPPPPPPPSAGQKKQHLVPTRSRRRRVAITSTHTRFSQQPYQCFQEARSFLQEDRAEKLEQIRIQREKIKRLKAKQVDPRDEWQKENRLRSMRGTLEEWKIQADINDPIVKRRFEDGNGDMSKPIYRCLADKQWRAYERVLLMQRITQMAVVPDVLPAIDPTVQTELYFPAGNGNMRRVQHGQLVISTLSERLPTLYIQPYDRGTSLVTIAVVNPDVPDVEKDGFDYRCHFLAANIPISPTNTKVQFATLDQEAQVILPWLPAYSQKGIEYQRMSIFILQQPASDSSDTATSQPLDISGIKEAGRYTTREGFNLRSFVDKFALKPVGVDLFRTKWDEETAGVMQRAGVIGWNVEFKRKRVEPLPYQRKPSERYR